MKNKLRFAAVAGVLVLAASAGMVRAEQPSGKIVVDEVVAVVGNSAILYSEVVSYSQQMQAQRREEGYTSDRDPINEALEALMLRKLLYNQALIDSVKVSLTDVDGMIDENVQMMVKKFGSISAMEDALHKTVFEYRDEMRQQATEMRHAQMMQQEVVAKVKITPGEVERYYRSLPKDSLPVVPEQYVYAQITKYPPSLGAAKQRTRERLLELRERIVGGSNFAALARMYSEDPGSAVRGGEMDPMPKDSYVGPFADAIGRLKPGQVSEVVETEFGFHIIELISRDGNLYHCRHILLRPSFTPAEMGATLSMLDSLAGRIRGGEITFEAAAMEYSDDKFSKLNGGLVSNHELLEAMNRMDPELTTTRFIKDQLQPNDYRILSGLKPGEVSKAHQSQDLKGNQMVKIVKLLEIIPAHKASLGDDYLDIERLAMEAKQEREFKKWLDKKIMSMYVRIDPGFRDGEFENKNWLK